MYNKEELLKIGRKLAEVCRETGKNPIPNSRYLSASSELVGFITALQFSGIISEEEAAEIARLALYGVPVSDIPGAFAEFISGLNLDNL